jgi:hypothetical protein
MGRTWRRCRTAIDATLDAVAQVPVDHYCLPTVRHLLANALFRTERYAEAVEQFYAVGGFIGSVPWSYFADPVKRFVRIRTNTFVEWEKAGRPAAPIRGEVSEPIPDAQLQRAGAVAVAACFSYRADRGRVIAWRLSAWVRIAARNWERTVGVTVRAVAGVSLSRRWQVVAVEASSRQSLPSPPPEKDDFCHFRPIVMFLTVP